MTVGDLIISKDRISYYSSKENIRRIGLIIKINKFKEENYPTTYTCWLYDLGLLELHPNQVELLSEETC